HDGSRHPQQDRTGQAGVPCSPLFFPYRMLHGIPSFLFAIYFDIKNHFTLVIIANKKNPFYSIRTRNNPFRHLFSNAELNSGSISIVKNTVF
ncbi:hypothetical protein AB840_13210, partial [Megasphaera cerevisiae DSM 20462]